MLKKEERERRNGNKDGEIKAKGRKAKWKQRR
jgi:hypothetical protein